MVRERTLVIRRRSLLAGLLVVASALGAPVVNAAEQQPQAPVAGQVPAAPAQPGAPAAPPQPRIFSTPAGLLFTPVRPERTADFEKVMAYLQAALENSTDETVREQARGWHIYKATEVVNGAVLYVYVLDPAVMGPEYGIGKILADAYPDQITQLWKLYTSAVSGGGTLLNLTPVKPVPPPPLAPTPDQKGRTQDEKAPAPEPKP